MEQVPVPPAGRHAVNHPTEPAAELREAASALWQTYIALTSEGFSEQQALVIIGQILASQGGQP